MGKLFQTPTEHTVKYICESCSPTPELAMCSTPMTLEALREHMVEVHGMLGFQKPDGPREQVMNMNGDGVYIRVFSRTLGNLLKIVEVESGPNNSKSKVVMFR